MQISTPTINNYCIIRTPLGAYRLYNIDNPGTRKLFVLDCCGMLFYDVICKRFNVFPFNTKSFFCHNITRIHAQLQYNNSVNNYKG